MLRLLVVAPTQERGLAELIVNPPNIKEKIQWVRPELVCEVEAAELTARSGRGQLAVFLRCSLLTYKLGYARRSRFEKQPHDPAEAGRKPCYLSDLFADSGDDRSLQRGRHRHQQAIRRTACARFYHLKREGNAISEFHRFGYDRRGV